MEKFALLEILKAFESLTAKRTAPASSDITPENEQTPPPSPQPAPQPPALPETFGTNVMADVIARHEEIANRIKNKK